MLEKQEDTISKEGPRGSALEEMPCWVLSEMLSERLNGDLCMLKASFSKLNLL